MAREGREKKKKKNLGRGGGREREKRKDFHKYIHVQVINVKDETMKIKGFCSFSSRKIKILKF